MSSVADGDEDVEAAAPLGEGPGADGAATGGLSLDAMPAPEHLGPLGAHLVGESFAACRGRVIFTGDAAHLAD